MFKLKLRIVTFDIRFKLAPGRPGTEALLLSKQPQRRDNLFLGRCTHLSLMLHTSASPSLSPFTAPQQMGAGTSLDGGI